MYIITIDGFTERHLSQLKDQIGPKFTVKRFFVDRKRRKKLQFNFYYKNIKMTTFGLSYCLRTNVYFTAKKNGNFSAYIKI